MLKKSFVFMMLLAASLIGISSAIHHQPETSIAQPQQSAGSPQQQQQQIQSPNTAPPTLGKRPAAPQGLQQQKSTIPTVVQIQEDKALVDRLLPYIIQKIDGKTLAQKIDTETLINKIGGKRLAQIVLPYIELKFGTSVRESAVITVNKGGLAPQPSVHQAVASCPRESKITGGGVVIMARGENALGGAADNQIIESRYGQLGNTWLGVVRMESGGSFYTQAVCAWPSLTTTP
jgi:hypothetical protein